MGIPYVKSFIFRDYTQYYSQKFKCLNNEYSYMMKHPNVHSLSKWRTTYSNCLLHPSTSTMTIFRGTFIRNIIQYSICLSTIQIQALFIQIVLHYSEAMNYSSIMVNVIDFFLQCYGDLRTFSLIKLFRCIRPSTCCRCDQSANESFFAAKKTIHLLLLHRMENYIYME